MVRPKKPRFVEFEPDVTYFKPRAVPIAELEEVRLAVDEYEAIRLSEIAKLDQTSAAQQMGLHQSTFHRTLAKAREKIADAIVNGKAIRIQGGVYKMPRGDGRGPMGGGFSRGAGMGRGAGAGIRSGGGQGAGRGAGFGGPSSCKCPKCGKTVPHSRGMPCTQMKCPECGSYLIRG